MTTILDPTDERVPVERTITPRPESIKGTVALLDISKPRGNVLIETEDLTDTRIAQFFEHFSFFLRCRSWGYTIEVGKELWIK